MFRQHRSGLWPSCGRASRAVCEQAVLSAAAPPEICLLSSVGWEFLFSFFFSAMAYGGNGKGISSPSVQLTRSPSWFCLAAPQRETPRRRTGWRWGATASCGPQGAPQEMSGGSWRPWPPCIVARAEETRGRLSWR